MDTLQITKDSALKAHTEADNKGKSLLENLFGKKVFQRSIIERVNGFEDGCRETRKCELEVAMINLIPDKVKRAQERIETVAAALREGKDPSECFYYPYFKRSSGGGFSFVVYVYDDDFTLVGARLRVDTAEKAAHLGKIMLEDYRIYLTGK